MRLYDTRCSSKGRITAQKYFIEKFEQAQLSKESVQFYLEKRGTRLDDDPESVPMEVVLLMKTILDSRGPRSSMIRTRNNGNRKRN